MAEKALRLLLEKTYGCQSRGKPIPPPYCSDDDMPEYFITPTNYVFSVPPPQDGATYSAFMVQKILDAGKLNVVIPMSANKEEGAEG